MPVTRTKGKLVDAAKFRVKYKDIFTAKEFYEALRFWLKENEWHDGNSFEQYETYLLEKITTGGFKEMVMQWRLQKTIDKYYRYHLDLDFLWLGMTSTEVIREGVKYRTDKGEVEVQVKAVMEFDYEGKLKSHPFVQHFYELLTKRILKKELDYERKIELYRQAYQLQNFMKQWFKLHRYLPYEEATPFFTSHAWPSHTTE